MRQYLPTFAELVDRLSIVILKSIFIPENKADYEYEQRLILSDLDEMLIDEGRALNAKSLRAVMIIMLTNRYIWENESKARLGGSEQDKLLKLSHSINGVRNSAKNVLAKEMGERVDLKIDSLSAELSQEFGNWELFK